MTKLETLSYATRTDAAETAAFVKYIIALSCTSSGGQFFTANFLPTDGPSMGVANACAGQPSNFQLDTTNLNDPYHLGATLTFGPTLLPKTTVAVVMPTGTVTPTTSPTPAPSPPPIAPTAPSPAPGTYWPTPNPSPSATPFAFVVEVVTCASTTSQQLCDLNNSTVQFVQGNVILAQQPLRYYTGQTYPYQASFNPAAIPYVAPTLGIRLTLRILAGDNATVLGSATGQWDKNPFTQGWASGLAPGVPDMNGVIYLAVPGGCGTQVSWGN